jgi:protocatechuate 3,4-dioxygenase beta subunit
MRIDCHFVCYAVSLMAHSARYYFFWLLVGAWLPTLTIAVTTKQPDHSITAPAAAQCVATTALATRNYPGSDAIPTTNNLTLPAGKAVEAEGQKIIIAGQLLDSACVPVANAQIELWQNDPYGRWILANDSDLVNARAVFTGAGRAVTNNNGEFYFTTMFPASIDGRAPNINIRIKAKGLKEFSTLLYFAGDQRNATDKLFSKLSATAQQSISIRMSQKNDGTLLGKITLALPGKIPYHQF